MNPERDLGTAWQLTVWATDAGVWGWGDVKLAKGGGQPPTESGWVVFSAEVGGGSENHCCQAGRRSRGFKEA